MQIFIKLNYSQVINSHFNTQGGGFFILGTIFASTIRYNQNQYLTMIMFLR